MRRALLIADSGVIEPRHLMLGSSASAPNYLQAIKNIPLTKTAVPAAVQSPVTIDLPVDEPDGLAGLEDIEKAHITRVLNAVGRNKTKAAEILGIARKTLRAKMEKYGLEDEVGTAA